MNRALWEKFAHWLIFIKVKGKGARGVGEPLNGNVAANYLMGVMTQFATKFERGGDSKVKQFFSCRNKQPRSEVLTRPF